MYRVRSLVAFLVVSSLSVGAFAQAPPEPPDPPGPPPGVVGRACGLVAGTLEITEQTDTNIEGTLSGDLEGTISLNILESSLVDLGFVSLSVLAFEGTIMTADGTLTVRGRQVQFELPGGQGTLLVGRHIIVAGDGDLEGAMGTIGNFSILNPMNSDISYQGVVCVPRQVR